MDVAEAKKEIEDKEASELQKALNEEQTEEVKTETKTETASNDQTNTDKPNGPKQDAQADLYGPNFKQLIDPEPSVISLFKFQMSRVQERSKNLIKLLNEAEKLIKAEQMSADALGKLGTFYHETELKALTEVASQRTMAVMQLDDGLVLAKSRLETFQLALHAVNQAEAEHEVAINTHLKTADSGRVVSSRGRYHQNLLEALVAAAHLQSFQIDFRQAINSYFKVILPDCKVESAPQSPNDGPNISRAQVLNKQVMEALQVTHYTLDSSSNGPPRGWLNLRVRGLPFSQWQRVFFYIQDCHMMKQSKEDINANIFFDFKNAQVQDCQVDDRANTFLVKTAAGSTHYFQAESFDAAIAWRVTIESMITAAQFEEHTPNPLSEDLASQLTRGRSQSDSGSDWMSNLKSGFSKLKTQATNAFDNLEQKLEKLDSEVISPTQQSRPISQSPVNPEDVEKINWEVPKHENSNVTPSGSSLECRYLGGRQSNISESKSFLESILLIRKHYDVPSPSICKLFIDQSDLTIHTSDDASHALRTKLIKHIPLEADLCGVLVDRDTNAEVWLLQGLDITKRIGELAP